MPTAKREPSRQVFRAINAIVLDVDGTLVDSNDQHAKAWCEALEVNGLKVSFPVVRRLIGMGGDKLVPRLTGFKVDTPLGKSIIKARSRLFRKKYLHEIKPFAGTRELLLRLRAARIQVVIATSADKHDLTELLNIARVADLIKNTASSADAARTKPDPGIVSAALRKLSSPKRKVLMVGDTPYDIEAAALAGIRTIALRCGGWTDPELVGALKIYDGPGELAKAL